MIAAPAKNVVALVKGSERFMFIYGDDQCDKSALTNTLGRFAADPELNFTWYDAACLAKRVSFKGRD